MQFDQFGTRSMGEQVTELWVLNRFISNAEAGDGGDPFKWGYLAEAGDPRLFHKEEERSDR